MYHQDNELRVQFMPGMEVSLTTSKFFPSGALCSTTAALVFAQARQLMIIICSWEVCWYIAASVPAQLLSGPTSQRPVLFDEITGWLRVEQGRY